MTEGMFNSWRERKGDAAGRLNASTERSESHKDRKFKYKCV